ncbi:MAG: binding domain protein [Myxococcales bacterium]|nr:binding domain protein [Myxococcales bacterium]
MSPPAEEDDFAKMLAEYEGPETGRSKKKRKEPSIGDPVKGRVISIGRDSAFVDIGGKSDGVIDLNQLRDADGNVTVAEGDEIEARVVEVGGPSGSVVLSRVLGRGAEGKAELEQAFQMGVPVEGVVSGVNKGGVEVTIAGVRAFCPISQLDLRHTEDANTFVGQKLRFRITRYELGGRGLNMVVSRRALLEEEQATRGAEVRATLAVGSVLRGKITAIKEYGAFVDLGGVEGMLHVSEIGFQRVSHPNEVLSVGQEVEVQVKKMEKSDDPKRPERISLSLKSLERDPWSDAATRFYEGARAAGTVKRLEQFGAFVEIAPGVEGLLHISELGAGRPLRHAKDATKIGAKLDVVVLAVDSDKRRLSLGLIQPGEEGENVPNEAAHSPTSLGTFADLLKGGKKK